MSNNFEDFEFQDEAVDDIINLLITKDQKNALLVSATGSGKTVISGKAFKEILKLNKGPVLAVLNLQSLVGQTYRELESLGINVTVVHNDVLRDKDGKFKTGWCGDVVLTMEDTFMNLKNGIVAKDLTFDSSFKPFLLWFDEAHQATSITFQQVRDTYPRAKYLGATATPYRDLSKPGESLEEWYGNNVIQTITMKELIRIGRLVQPIYRNFDESDHVVDMWLEYTKDRVNKSTVVFAGSIMAAVQYVDAFRSRGITAERYTSAADNKDTGFKVANVTHSERIEIDKAFSKGEVTVLVTVDALAEGWNNKRAEILVFAKKVGNPAVYNQIIGRVMRAFFDKKGHVTDAKDYKKKDCLVLDFFGNVDGPEGFGPVEDIDWSDKAKDQRTASTKTVGLEVSDKVYAKRSVITHSCACCKHVYNVKKSRVCTNENCGAPSGFKVITKVKDVMEKMMKKLNIVDEVQANSALRLAGRILTGQSTENLTAEWFNARWKNEIFDEDENLTEEFDFIGPLIDMAAKSSKNLKMTAKIAV